MNFSLSKKNITRILAAALLIFFLFSLTGCAEFNQMFAAENSAASVEEQEIQDEEATERIIVLERFAIMMLLIAALVAMITRRLRIPYTVGLVLVGLALVIFTRGQPLHVPPELILTLFIPPLVFEAAYHINFTNLKKDFSLISLLAIPGVILTTLMVGGIVSFGAGIDFKIALIFGALIAATDPVSVVAIFRSIGVPKRLQVLLEGESLFNDGTAIVVFNLMVSIAITGQFDLTNSILQFVIIAGGGLIVGVILSSLAARVVSQIDDYLIETTITVILAYAAYFIAEEIFGVSGVLAVVSAGLTFGNLSSRTMSPTTKIVIVNFWEFGAFLANSMVFLLIGLQINIDLLIHNAVAILWAILAVLLARAVSIYAFSKLGKDIPWKWKHVLFWGGLRGAISLALALSLSTEISGYTQLQAMAFGVVLFSILVEGLSMGPLIKRMKLIGKSKSRDEYELNHARAIAMQASVDHLEKLKKSGLISNHALDVLAPIFHQRTRELNEEAREILSLNPELQEDEMQTAWREALRAQRTTIAELYRENILSEENHNQIISELDSALQDQESLFPKLNASITEKNIGKQN